MDCLYDGRGRVVRQLPRVEGTECTLSGLAPGDYIWSVRARFRVDGREWITRWHRNGNQLRFALVPERGFAPFSVAPRR